MDGSAAGAGRLLDQRYRQPFCGAAQAGRPQEEHHNHRDLEILSLAGTLAPDGAHLHIAVANSTGTVAGGHLSCGTLVRTTAELVVALLPGWVFQRVLDPATGYPELHVRLLG